MKGYPSKNMDNSTNFSTIVNTNLSGGKETPMKLQLKLRLNHESLPVQNKVKEEEAEEQGQEMMTNRTGGVNEFQLPSKESIVPVSSKSSNIRSYLRIKPNKNISFMPLDVYNNQTIVHDRSVYKFDHIFQSTTQQTTIYEIVGKEVTQKFIEGFNGTIFAYGSTGSGKTYTMFGSNDGLVPSVVQEIFVKLGASDRVSCSMLQIYKQSLIDLLSGESELELKIKQISNICSIQNLSVHQIKSKQETLNLINRGNHLKKIRQTNLNESSSRSHVVFILYLQKIDSQGRIIRAKYNLVDLAGSEKVFKSKVEGQGLEQAKKINLSLSCLGNTISAIVKNSDHIPYRESKLTRILKESLMGNSITRLIVTCSINEEAIEEAISSIKFAQRARKVQTQAEVAYNINKFKGEKGEKQKQVRMALEQAETKLNKISEKVEQVECKVCQEVSQLLKQKEQLSPEEMFTFNPITHHQSPKSKIDLRGFMSNPGNRFSSVPKRQFSKKNSIKKNLVEEHFQEKTLENRKIFQLKQQNDKLRQDKKTLETRIKVLEQNMTKQSKFDYSSLHRKVIKLGTNDRNQSKSMKQNQPKAANLNQITTSNKQKDIFKTQVSISHRNKTQAFSRQVQRMSEFKNIWGMIYECVGKMEAASQNYRSTVRPLEIEVLSQEVILLEQQLLQKNNKKQKKTDLSSLLKFHSQLKKSLCSYYDEMVTSIKRLFDFSLYQHKDDLSLIFREKQKEISHINFNIKEYLQDYSDDLTDLNIILQKDIISDRLKEDSCYQEVDKKKHHLQDSYNQFLTMEQIAPIRQIKFMDH